MAGRQNSWASRVGRRCLRAQAVQPFERTSRQLQLSPCLGSPKHRPSSHSPCGRAVPCPPAGPEWRWPRSRRWRPRAPAGTGAQCSVNMRHAGSGAVTTVGSTAWMAGATAGSKAGAARAPPCLQALEQLRQLGLLHVRPQARKDAVGIGLDCLKRAGICTRGQSLWEPRCLAGLPKLILRAEPSAACPAEWAGAQKQGMASLLSKALPSVSCHRKVTASSGSAPCCSSVLSTRWACDARCGGDAPSQPRQECNQSQHPNPFLAAPSVGCASGYGRGQVQQTNLPAEAPPCKPPHLVCILRLVQV